MECLRECSADCGAGIPLNYSHRRRVQGMVGQEVIIVAVGFASIAIKQCGELTAVLTGQSIMRSAGSGRSNGSKRASSWAVESSYKSYSKQVQSK